MEYLTLLCLLPFLSAQSLTFEEQSGIAGQLKWHGRSNVTLVCVSSPYMGVITLTYNSENVYACTHHQCSDNLNSNAEFSFTSKTTTGEFTWKITPVSMKHNGKLFGCSDDLRNITYVATVIEPNKDPTNKGNDLKSIMVIYFICVISVIVKQCE